VSGVYLSSDNQDFASTTGYRITRAGASAAPIDDSVKRQLSLAGADSATFVLHREGTLIAFATGDQVETAVWTDARKTPFAIEIYALPTAPIRLSTVTSKGIGGSHIGNYTQSRTDPSLWESFVSGTPTKLRFECGAWVVSDPDTWRPWSPDGTPAHTCASLSPISAEWYALVINGATMIPMKTDPKDPRLRYTGAALGVSYTYAPTDMTISVGPRTYTLRAVGSSSKVFIGEAPDKSKRTFVFNVGPWLPATTYTGVDAYTSYVERPIDVNAMAEMDKLCTGTCACAALRICAGGTAPAAAPGAPVSTIRLDRLGAATSSYTVNLEVNGPEEWIGVVPTDGGPMMVKARKGTIEYLTTSLFVSSTVTRTARTVEAVEAVGAVGAVGAAGTAGAAGAAVSYKLDNDEKATVTVVSGLDPFTASKKEDSQATDAKDAKDATDPPSTNTPRPATKKRTNAPIAKEPESDNTALIIGVVSAVTVVLFVGVALTVWFNKSRKSRNSRNHRIKDFHRPGAWD
jgi:hypothetical protein